MQDMENTPCQSVEDNKTPCWNCFKQVVNDIAKASLRKHYKKHKDWFDPTDQMLPGLMVKRDKPHKKVLQIRSTRSAVEADNDTCRILHKYTRACKSERWEMKANELQRAADRNDMKSLYSGLMEV